MQKKLTITIDERVYEGLQTVVGPRRIRLFLTNRFSGHLPSKNRGKTTVTYGCQ